MAPDAILVVTGFRKYIAIETVERVGLNLLPVYLGLHIPIGQFVDTCPTFLTNTAPVNLETGDASVLPPEAQMAMRYNGVANLDIVRRFDETVVLDREYCRSNDELQRAIILYGTHNVLVLMTWANITVHPSHSHAVGNILSPFGQQHAERLFCLLVLINLVKRTESSGSRLSLVGSQSTLAVHDTHGHAGYAVFLRIGSLELLKRPRSQIGHQRVAERIVAHGRIVVAYNHQTILVEGTLCDIVLGSPAQHHTITIGARYQIDTCLNEMLGRLFHRIGIRRHRIFICG